MFQVCLPQDILFAKAEKHIDGIQDKLPPNMAPHHIEYFKWKEFEKTAEKGRSLWPHPSLLFCNRSWNPDVRGALPYTWRKGVSFISKDKATLKKIHTGHAQYPQLPMFTSYSLTYHFSTWLSTLHQTQHKNAQV